VRLPPEVRSEVAERVFREADAAGWSTLPQAQRVLLYEHWSRDPGIGGVLQRYFDLVRVRVYLKDTLLREYVRESALSPHRPLAALGISAERVQAHYSKPLGCRLVDGRIICWGTFRQWKSVAMAVFERARLARATPFAVVLVGSDPHAGNPEHAAMVDDACCRLGIVHVVRLDKGS